MITDSYVVYMKVRADGTLLAARYEVHDGDTYAIIGGEQMTDAWLRYARPDDAIVRLHELGRSAALNAPEEKQLTLEDF